jgi:Bacteriophage Sf6, terminase small subunit-like
MSDMPPESASPPRKVRPTSITPEVADRLFTALRENPNLREVCQREDLPDKATVLRRRNQDPQFEAAYLAAKQAGLDELAEDALSDASNATPVTAAAERLRFDARRWYLSKLSPKKWGDKVVNEHTGAAGGPVILQAAAPPMVPHEVAAGIRALLSKAEVEMGLPPADDQPDGERVQRLLASGEVLSPDIYEVLFVGGGHDG